MWLPGCYGGCRVAGMTWSLKDMSIVQDLVWRAKEDEEECKTSKEERPQTHTILMST